MVDADTAYPRYRANFGDGTYTSSWPDIRDAKLAIWGRAAIVQYRSYLEVQDGAGQDWTRVPDTRPAYVPIVEQRA